MEAKEALIECGACGVENQFTDLVPGVFLPCNQCRENLMGESVADSHTEYVCRDCGFILLMLKETPVLPGEARCRCGSAEIEKKEFPTLLEMARQAPVPPEKEEDGMDDGGWVRSDSAAEHLGDYNELFDDDPAGPA